MHAENDKIFLAVVSFAKGTDGHGCARAALAVMILPVAVVTGRDGAAINAEHAPFAFPRSWKLKINF